MYFFSCRAIHLRVPGRITTVTFRHPFIFTFFIINKIRTHSFILITVVSPLVMLLNFTHDDSPRLGNRDSRSTRDY